jgi:5-methylthioadenosine/S-adenosylhomocysteine deaminase
MDLLITGGTVVTMDAERRVIEDGAVLVHEDRIAAVGRRTELTQRYASASRTIDAHDSLVLPGLINGHAHAAMSLFRGIADDQPLDTWLQRYIFPAEGRNVSEDFVAWGTRLGLLEMLRSGITTFADMYYFEDAVARVTREAGMRGVLGQTIVDFPAPDNRSVPAALTYADDYIRRWKGDPLVTPAIAPHSLYAVSEKNLRDCAEMARSHGAPILMHLAEARFETNLCRERHGLSPVAYLESIGFLGSDVTAAHCVWEDAADIERLARLNVGCVHNPSSNMKLASGVMPVIELLVAGVAVGIATDGAASNNRQDLFMEIDLAAKLQKITRMDPSALPARDVLEMATIGGARALHLDHAIGSIEEGKQADLIIVDLTAPHATPIYNIYSHIVYALKASDVKTALIAGKIVMRDRRMLTLDEIEILAKAREYQRKVSDSLIAPALL